MEVRYLLRGQHYFPISSRGKPRNMLSQEYPDVIHVEERSFHDADLTTVLGLRGQARGTSTLPCADLRVSLTVPNCLYVNWLIREES